MTRSEMKARAKAQLGNGIFKNNWMLALLACVIQGALTVAASGVIPGLGAVLISGPLAFGVCYLFIKQARDGQPMDIAQIFEGFKVDFGKTFLLGLMIGIYSFLWGLLFIIPGIVKVYSYGMAYYILNDNRELGWNDAITASRKLMKGHKWQLFVLDLSFIGWYIVGALVLGVGTLWVVPYHEATRAQFYESIKDELVIVNQAQPYTPASYEETSEPKVYNADVVYAQAPEAEPFYEEPTVIDAEIIETNDITSEDR